MKNESLEADIRLKLNSLISRCMSCVFDDIVINDESNLITDLGFDSITIMQLVVEIEETFSVDFSDAEFEVLSTVSSIRDYILSKICS